ncbi:ATP-binding protein [Bacillus sp. FJAT-45350]|uniref:ATP-binding protein n=1 Tax=Bacillus sp. FJAT-45350 TaxID=2011014 RepID=UPI000BB7FEED|nr:sensor histidine kinase [Bacillus sp. FJAT-45350]
MNTYMSELLLNMLILIVFLLFVPQLVRTKINNKTAKAGKILLLLSAIVATIGCMTFPFHIGEGLILDLRAVAIVGAGLYLGRTATVTLVLVSILYRYILGGVGPGFYTAIIIGVLTLLFVFALHKQFTNKSLKTKISIGASILLCIAITVLLLLNLVFDYSISLYFGIAFVVLHLVSIFLFIYFFEYISESNSINQQIIKAEKLEIVSQLASSVSHEVRNPLTVVKGFLQMLRQSDLAEEKKDMYVDLSLKEIDRATEIITNYLTFAKPYPEDMMILNIRDVLDGVQDIVFSLAILNSIELRIKIDSHLVKGNKQLLQQCFLNIMKNCIEAMHDGGTLTIITEHHENKFAVVISDNGVGMSKEQLQRIGEPYFTTKGREGTGLGMMAVYKIIELHNGHITVHSEIEKGTEFKLFLPIVKN